MPEPTLAKKRYVRPIFGQSVEANKEACTMLKHISIVAVALVLARSAFAQTKAVPPAEPGLAARSEPVCDFHASTACRCAEILHSPAASDVKPELRKAMYGLPA